MHCLPSFVFVVLTALPSFATAQSSEPPSKAAEFDEQGAAQAPDARQIVKAAIDQWRGVSSVSELSMSIRRPDWERTMTMRAWTRGDEQSLVRVLAPSKDRGNGTLTDDDNMWTFSPRVNRVIKIPSSMMNQSWMGSDFSNKDVTRADDIVDQYTHTLTAIREQDGIVVYEIEAVPLEDAAVVWGREVMLIRGDYVLTEHRYYDQDDELVKTLTSLEIGEMGGRMLALRQRMQEVDSPGAWTEIAVKSAEYDIDLPDRLFTLSNLRNPRD